MTVPYPTANFGLYPDFTAQYSSNLELLLQQMQSVLRPHVSEQGGLVGKMASPVTQYSSITMKAPIGRFSPLNHTNPYSIRPWMMPQPGELVELIDDYDRLQTIVDPTSAYMKAATAATNRYYDDGIITATTGTRQIGTDIGNLTADTFSTTQYQIASTFGSSSASGLTVAKLIRNVFVHIFSVVWPALLVHRPRMHIAARGHEALSFDMRARQPCKLVAAYSLG